MCIRDRPYTRLCGGDWQSARPLAPFDGGVMAFLSDLGAALRLRQPHHQRGGQRHERVNEGVADAAVEPRCV